jgi:hypothetical protein
MDSKSQRSGDNRYQVSALRAGPRFFSLERQVSFQATPKVRWAA